MNKEEWVKISDVIKVINNQVDSCMENYDDDCNHLGKVKLACTRLRKDGPKFGEIPPITKKSRIIDGLRIDLIQAICGLKDKPLDK